MQNFSFHFMQMKTIIDERVFIYPAIAETDTHYLFEVGGVDEVVYVAVGVGDDRVFRREPPFSVNDELILMKTSGELLR